MIYNNCEINMSIICIFEIRLFLMVSKIILYKFSRWYNTYINKKF